MEKVISRDGTSIAYHRLGAGPPLVIVHGSGASNATSWKEVTPALAEHFTIYAMDRRGYGESGDRAEYALARDTEDIAAVMDSAGAPAALFGHSYGALCALEAALGAKNINKLILYEPGFSRPNLPLYPAGFIDRMNVLIAAGDHDGVVTTIYREIAMIPQEQIDQFKTLPTWSARLAAAPNLVREARVEDTYDFSAARFQALRVPTLLLLGGESTGVLKAATDTLHAALPNSRIEVLPEQQHVAMYSAPDLLTQKLLQFLLETREHG